MTRWCVLIAVGAPDDTQQELGPDALDGFVEVLVRSDPEGDKPVAASGPREWSVRLTVVAATAAEALPVAAQRCYRAGREVRLPRWPIVRIGVVRAAELKAGLAPTEVRPAKMPPLVGVSEIAGILNLSRQRASEVTRLDGFPEPVAALASGPVWLEPAVLRFAETWSRKPGRPPGSGRRRQRGEDTMAPPPAVAT